MNHEYSPTDTTYNNFSGGKRNIYNIVSLRKTFKLYKENVRRSQCQSLILQKRKKYSFVSSDVQLQVLGAAGHE